MKNTFLLITISCGTLLLTSCQDFTDLLPITNQINYDDTTYCRPLHFASTHEWVRESGKKAIKANYTVTCTPKPGFTVNNPDIGRIRTTLDSQSQAAGCTKPDTSTTTVGSNIIFKWSTTCPYGTPEEKDKLQSKARNALQTLQPLLKKP